MIDTPVDALSILRDDPIDLCLSFSFGLGVSGSLSLSLSFGIEGMCMGAEGREGTCGKGRVELDDALDELRNDGSGTEGSD